MHRGLHCEPPYHRRLRAFPPANTAGQCCFLASKMKIRRTAARAAPPDLYTYLMLSDCGYCTDTVTPLWVTNEVPVPRLIVIGRAPVGAFSGITTLTCITP